MNVDNLVQLKRWWSTGDYTPTPWDVLKIHEKLISKSFNAEPLQFNDTKPRTTSLVLFIVNVLQFDKD